MTAGGCTPEPESARRRAEDAGKRVTDDVRAIRKRTQKRREDEREEERGREG